MPVKKWPWGVGAQISVETSADLWLERPGWVSSSRQRHISSDDTSARDSGATDEKR